MKKIYDNNGNVFAELNHGKKYFLDYSKHSHETLALSILGSGEIDAEFHSKDSQVLIPNKIVIFNPNEVHRTKSRKKENVDYFTLHLDVKWCKSIQNEENFIYLQNLIEDEIIYKELLKIFKSIINTDSKVNINRLKTILEKILKEYMCFDNKSNESEDEHIIFKEVEKYIQNNLCNAITLSDISKAIGYNEFYIIRVFKKKFGLTPHAFLINKRIEKARQELTQNRDINLSQLSCDVGFYDQSHFSKVFKRVFAKTPNNYKNEK
ncbi:AraC family transcriptional regulator [Poseidonibacter lekithochrous]|uniref:AraC family transcriptional regulator n=1 Tax=Poseidonibacter lekithochrous TaxID=1904463 RepID=UPI000D36D11E|nr:AraC family transcriptional regulator [Poseidonibacter lekithochrous]